ncbi:transcription termination factor NusA [Candidatus Giovannonibacteria bacterium RIFCSPLOWO2_02_FULL_43_11b]|uniref:Transcription termination/antitermination protein NusA n=1 Tax=Candidatus Giovannonibacteria bacterium RIFCSPHIGHO2_12_FULL_43_15 TaxID=1798341 RepID=A0A1F5WPC9_9BACT|nr:MAG: transcription termination factor NusA [Candidatus Giovannonibacteria bacterium RIFCSPHIGHO2_01_FULL_43_100]OGF66688.1 MAG: transcription termination factor NusA [Candidatus Giovannonibacteria bacterium RIFCSPHIGHO2_02_FULL_43_32]OGF77464.1 MAG: transcription termination factor NusA [Candidatus Giovannonibacteria bacterium RIFCSPHIGHO2_12_FULL_43_15]OGF78400.1 MAG: transcription termination factor NusA [Candidatus Giovannonibacteria bacterium RIFCSPLOWO2_01_FULL_43_60]OGF90261.1 MAG: tra
MSLDLKNFQSALEEVLTERGISREKILETIEMALAAAYKKDYGKRGQIIKAKFNSTKGKAEFYQVKIVVDESMLKPAESEVEGDIQAGKEDELEEVEGEIKKVRFNPERHIMIEEAKKIKADVNASEELIFPLETKEEYGRIAAQTAKQVIIQRIREAERESIYTEYASKQGEIVSGIVQRIEGKNVFLDLGRATALLPKEEQVRGERYRIGERIKAYLLLAEKNPRGPGLYLSRSHPKFVAELFKTEVPEIHTGIVEVRAIAREAGLRTKIAVSSKEDGVDPVGSLVGQKGIRVGTVISELGGEKIDIIEWRKNLEEFIAKSLSPAKVLEVDINPERKEAQVKVAEDQLSLAIGKAGQNVRLAAKLTGYKIDIRSRTGETVASVSEEGEEIQKHE